MYCTHNKLLMARPKKPNTDFKVALRVTGRYRYAATQPHVRDPKTGNIVRRYVYWGEVSETLKFLPNDRYILASDEERNRLIFPESWDISAIDSVRKISPDIPVISDPCIANDGSAFSGTVRTCSSKGQFSNRFYGGTWFLWQIAVRKHVVEDLLRVFDDRRSVVNDIMTLAMFPILTRWSYSQTERWQRYTKTPSERQLTPCYITRLTQCIDDSHRMQFLKLRIRRQNGKALVACDSTTRSAYGRCLADIRWGHNKDNEALQNTLEVVVYSLDTHEPIYYRTFGGNENDSRTLRTIVSDLVALHCGELTVIFDRGYESEENIDAMINAEQCFLVCGKVCQKPVINSVYKVEYDPQGLPTNMDYSSEYRIYAAQFEEKRTVTGNSGSGRTVTMKVNLFLDMKKRMTALTDINEKIKAEAALLKDKEGKSMTKEECQTLFKRLSYHKVKLSGDKLLLTEPHEKAIAKDKAMAGFFSSVSYKVDGNALEQYRMYILRDEQEKYFEEMKDQLGFDMQEDSSEDGKTGRLFILFIALIMRSEIRAVWGSKLKKDYPSSIDVLHEMAPIRYVEYEGGSAHITGFTTPQTDICRAFAIPVPEDCLSSCQKAAVDKATSGRGPGRPKGSLNKKKAVGSYESNGMQKSENILTVAELPGASDMPHRP